MTWLSLTAAFQAMTPAPSDSRLWAFSVSTWRAGRAKCPLLVILLPVGSSNACRFVHLS